MDTAHLVKMANQIGQYFAAYPCHEEAVRSVADHLTRFWAPRMRQALQAHVQVHGHDSGLSELALAAVRSLSADHAHDQ
jgi:formate dehydrogenase subunit delta